VLATFANLSAIVDYLTRSGAQRVLLVPAGNIAKQAMCSEDDGCARVLSARLQGEAIDIQAVIAACIADDRITRRRTKEPILEEDLPLCFALDTQTVVPRVVPQPDQVWFAVQNVSGR
jgi:phosphosulfolactate phosphohydrolase-like enzyme